MSLFRHIDIDWEEQTHTDCTDQEVLETSSIIGRTAGEVCIFGHIIFKLEVHANEVIEEESEAESDDAGEFRTFEVIILSVIAGISAGAANRIHNDGTEPAIDMEIVVQDPPEHRELTIEGGIIQTDIEIHRSLCDCQC